MFAVSILKVFDQLDSIKCMFHEEQTFISPKKKKTTKQVLCEAVYPEKNTNLKLLKGLIQREINHISHHKITI